MSQDGNPLVDQAFPSFGNAQLYAITSNEQNVLTNQMRAMLWKHIPETPVTLTDLDTSKIVNSLSHSHVPASSQQANIPQTVARQHNSVTDTIHEHQAWKKPIPIYNDELLWCDDCQACHADQCKHHGSLVVVHDRIIPSRAKLTTPHFLSVRKVTYIAGQEEDVYGIFTRKVIQKRTRFGPYEGKLCDEWTYADRKRNDRIPIKLFMPGGHSQYYDCTDQQTCNWMMFVQPAHTVEEQNVVVYQHKGAIYMTSIKHIAMNAELKAGYSKQYAEWMGQPTLTSGGQIEDIIKMITGQLESADDSIISETNIQDANEIDVSFSSEGLGETTAADAGHTVEGNFPGSEQIKSEKKIPDTPEDNSSTCGICGQTFPSVADCQSHDCGASSMDEIDLGRRTLNKRKGRPLKIKSKRKRGRPRKQLNPVMDDEDKLVDFPIEKPVELEIPLKRKRGRPKKYDTEGELLPSRASTPKPKVPKEKKLVVKKEAQQGQLHICDICGKAFGKIQKLQIHIYQHTGERPFKCTECPHAFTSKYKLVRHQLIHNGGKKYICFYCMKGFARKDHLKNHVRTHDPNKDQHKCDQCGKTYASSYCYRTHLTTHAIDNNDLECKVCKQKFDDKNVLINHLKMHKGSRMFKSPDDKKHSCPFCDKLFFTKKDVKRHVVVHTKSRDFLCQFCPQAFSRRDHLARHVTHTHSSEVDADKLAPGGSSGWKRGWSRPKSGDQFQINQNDAVALENISENINSAVPHDAYNSDKNQFNVINYNPEPNTLRGLETISRSAISELNTSISDQYLAHNIVVDSAMKQADLMSTQNQMGLVMKSMEQIMYLQRPENVSSQYSSPLSYVPQYTMHDKHVMHSTDMNSEARHLNAQSMTVNIAQPGQPQTTLIMSCSDVVKLLGLPDDQQLQHNPNNLATTLSHHHHN